MGLPGVGLGLPLSRLLAEQQNGTLRYIDNGGGAMFELTLPVAVPDTDLAKKTVLNLGLVGESRTPTRKPAVAFTMRLLAELDELFTATAEETRTWTGTTEPQLTPATRRRLEAISARHTTTPT